MQRWPRRIATWDRAAADAMPGVPAWCGHERLGSMDYAHLGRSGLRVSRLCLGTMNFGPLTPPADAHAIMDRAHDLGINFFDTANRYGGAFSPPGQVANNDQSHPGWTEEII